MDIEDESERNSDRGLIVKKKKNKEIKKILLCIYEKLIKSHQGDLLKLLAVL